MEGKGADDICAVLSTLELQNLLEELRADVEASFQQHQRRLLSCRIGEVEPPSSPRLPDLHSAHPVEGSPDANRRPSAPTCGPPSLPDTGSGPSVPGAVEELALEGQLLSVSPSWQEEGGNNYKEGWVGSLQKKEQLKRMNTSTMLGAVTGSSGSAEQPTVSSQRRTNWLRKLTHRVEYEATRTAVIVMDAALLFWETEHAARSARGRPEASRHGIYDEDAFVALQDIFCLLFIVDLIIRLKVERYELACNSWNGWRWFNIVVVVSYLLQTAAHHAQKNQRSYSGFRLWASHLSMLRVLRLLQVVQVAPAIRRNSFFRELRIMVSSLTGALKSLLWSSVMIFIVIIVFGLLFVEGVLGYCIRNAKFRSPDSGDLLTNFGTLSSCMLTLYKSMTGGVDWGEAYMLLEPLGWFYEGLFLAFTAFSFIALLNSVTAVFVESTMQRSANDRELMVQSEQKNKRDFLRTMETIFSELDCDGNGEIAFEELQEQVKEPAVGAYFTSLGVDVQQIEKLFQLLDTDRSGSIDREEFIFGCLRLRGEAKSLDLAIMGRELKHMSRQLTNLVQALEGGTRNRLPISPRKGSFEERKESFEDIARTIMVT